MNNVLNLTMNFSVHCECLPWQMKLKVKLDIIENYFIASSERTGKWENVTHEVNCPWSAIHIPQSSRARAVNRTVFKTAQNIFNIKWRKLPVALGL